MNERIRELYITAMREDCGEKWDTQQEFITRFAELIVRECRDWIDTNVGMVDEEATHDLLKHFGVEL